MNKHIYPIAAIVIITVAVVAFILGRNSQLPLISTSGTGEEKAGMNGETGAKGVDTRSVESVIATQPDITRFAALFSASSVDSQIAGSGKYTVFAPTNGAFALASKGGISGLTGAKLNDFIKNHIVAKNIDIEAVETGFAKSLFGNDLSIDKRDQDDAILVGSGFVIKTYKTGNGTVYIISAVLLPPEKSR